MVPIIGTVVAISIVALVFSGVFVPPTNEAPVANAGFIQTVNAGDTVSLGGSASGDPDGDPLT